MEVGGGTSASFGSEPRLGGGLVRRARATRGNLVGGRPLLAGPQPASAAGRDDHGRLLERFVAVALLQQVDRAPARPRRRGAGGGRVLRVVVGGAVEDPVAQVAEALGDLADGRAGDDQSAEQREEHEQRDGARTRHRGREGARREEADDAARGAHRVGAVRRVRDAVGDVGEPAGGEGQGHGADDEAVRDGFVLRSPQEVDPEGEQDERHRIPDPTEGPGDDSVDDVADDALHAPPLTGRDDDGQPDEREPDPVAAVLRLEVARRAADPADGATGQVRDPHPGSPDRAQR